MPETADDQGAKTLGNQKSQSEYEIEYQKGMLTLVDEINTLIQFQTKTKSKYIFRVILTNVDNEAVRSIEDVDKIQKTFINLPFEDVHFQINDTIGKSTKNCIPMGGQRLLEIKAHCYKKKKSENKYRSECFLSCQ